MLDLDKKEQEIIVEDESELIDLFKAIPDSNIAFAFHNSTFPKLLHVLRVNGRTTVRQMDYELLKLERSGN